MEIKKIIEKGETQTVEFKKSMSEMKEGCKVLCGMLNTERGSGLVLFGISPNCEVTGLENINLDQAQRTLAQHIQQKFDPKMNCSIEIIRSNNATIIAISAQRPKNICYYEYNGRAFIEGGSTKKLYH